MITKWKLFNFKSIRKETELDFAPLTIFAGANSSGKSTILQSILLVAQTLSHKVRTRSVVLNGTFIRLGQFDDLRSTDSESNQIAIGWTCEPTAPSHIIRGRVAGHTKPGVYLSRQINPVTSIGCEISFDTEGTGAQKEVTQIQPRLFSSRIDVVARDQSGADLRQTITVRRSPGDQGLLKREWMDMLADEGLLSRSTLDFEVDLDEGLHQEIKDELSSGIPIGCILRHFLPERLTVGFDALVENTRLIYSVLTGEAVHRMPRRFYQGRDLIVPSSIVALIISAISKVKRDNKQHHRYFGDIQESLFNSEPMPLEIIHERLHRLPPPVRMDIHRELVANQDLEKQIHDALKEMKKEELSIAVLRPHGVVSDAMMYLEEFFSSSIRYLGPLRDEPKSQYPLYPNLDPYNIGLKGENTAAVLELHKNSRIQYIPTSAFKESEIKERRINRSLEVAVIEWLKYLGIAESVESRDKGKFGHELKVQMEFSKRSCDLTHVGVGVSQVLPILVACLLAEPDTTLIFEQPELHLHPRVQTLLGDFFLSMSRLGKQCIIETHSEYLINRIRFRTAASMGSINPWIDSVKIYFAELGQSGSEFRSVDINEYGAILNWPLGFFDQSQQEAEAILRAAAIKRKTKREK